jgi:hypothetical protein
MSDATSLVEQYIRVWNETDQLRRRALIEQVFTGDVVYTDPLASVRGHDALDQLIAAAQSQFAGLQFSLDGPVDAHHDQARFRWNLASAQAQEPLVVGFDVAVLERDRIQSVYGFLDKVPT